MSEQNIEFHPVTEIFPLMEGEQFAELVSDIKANGLHEAIWLHDDGRIIDGRNRYRACLQAEVAPKFQTWNWGGSLVAFVVSLNLHRRHLTALERARASLASLPMLEAEAKERRLANLKRGDTKPDHPLMGDREARRPQSTKQAAKLFEVSHGYVSNMKRIQNLAPEKLDEMMRGQTTLLKVNRELRAEGKISTPLRGPRSRVVTKRMKDDVLFPFIETLYQQLTEKRRIQKHAQLKRTWNHEAIIKKELMDIIDWLERELLQKIETFTPRRSLDGDDRANHEDLKKVGG